MMVVQPHRRVVRSGSVAAARVALMDGEHTLEKPVRLSAAATVDDTLERYGSTAGSDTLSRVLGPAACSGVQMMLLFSDTIVIAEPVLEKGVKEGEEDLKCVATSQQAVVILILG